MSCLIQIYPAFANSVDPDQKDSDWSGSACFTIQYVNLCQQSGSRNLIVWQLEVGVASWFIQHDKGYDKQSVITLFGYYHSVFCYFSFLIINQGKYEKWKYFWLCKWDSPQIRCWNITKWLLESETKFDVTIEYVIRTNKRCHIKWQMPPLPSSPALSPHTCTLPFQKKHFYDLLQCLGQKSKGHSY